MLFQRLTFQDPPAAEMLNRMQDGVAASFRAVAASLLLGVTRTTVAALNNSTDTQVFHGLGRIPKGYIAVGSNVAATPYDGALASSNPRLYLTLRASATANMTLVFF